MKITIVGSRGVVVNNIERYVSDATEIVSGGAVGVDSCAREFAKKKGRKALRGYFLRVISKNRWAVF